MNIIRAFSILPVIFLVVGCTLKTDTGHENANEFVLTDGMSVVAENVNGKLTIQAGKKYQRSFTWAGSTRIVELQPREDRWNGSFGLYFPGRGNHWEKHDNITRAVIEEGVLHFNSKDEVLEYIARYEDQGSLSYNDSGLFVYWDKSPGAGGTLNVQVWKFLINGYSPNSLPGSNNTKITLIK